MTSATSLLGAGATPGAGNQNTGAAAAQQGQQMFLQLLVAQLQNQDPLNPADSMTFVTQLAQFSQVETLLGIRSDLGVLIDQTAPKTGSADSAAPAPKAT